RAQYDSYGLVKVTHFIGSYFIWIVFAFGFPGNIASILTITTMPTISSSKAHVAILAVTDTLAIVSRVTYNEVSGHRAPLSTPGCNIIFFVQQFCVAYANWVVVAMTTERCLAVCFPLRVGQMYTRRKALAVLSAFAVMTASVYVLLLWAFVEAGDSRTGYYCQLKPRYRAYLRGQVHYWLDACIAHIIPCVLVLTGNALIVVSIRRARRVQRSLTSVVDRGGRQSKDQRQITCMLIAVSVVFLLLNVPNSAFYLLKDRLWPQRPPAYSYSYAQYMFIGRLVHALTDANHAVNFYLYFLSMSTFRRRFLDSVRCRSRSQRSGPSSSVHRTSQTYMQCPNIHRDSARPDTGTSAATAPYTRRFNGCGSSGSVNAHLLKSFNTPPYSNHYHRASPARASNDSFLSATSHV
ncbi:hypothetical protein EGW08_008688, partial [Elysia chlorotica]